MLARLIADLDAILKAPSAAGASEGFFGLMQQLGASYLQTRIYLRPEGPLTSDKHFLRRRCHPADRARCVARQRCVRFCLLPLQSAA